MENLFMEKDARKNYTAPEEDLEIYSDDDEPYIFVSYAHEDIHLVRPILKRLIDEHKFRIWFDQGMNNEGELDFERVLGSKITHPNCVAVIAFVSKSSMQSAFCGQELALALGLQKKIICYGLFDDEVPKRDENGNVVYLKDEHGDFVYEKDENDQIVCDESGNPKKIIEKVKIPLIEDGKGNGIVPKIMSSIVGGRDHVIHSATYSRKKVDEFNGLLTNFEITAKAKHCEEYEDSEETIIKKCRDGKRVIRLNDSVKRIRTKAFKGCKKLVEIDLNQVEVIEGYAFEECEGISRLYIPKTVKYIGEYAFKDCGRIEEIVFDPDITELYIDEGAFMDCDNLKGIKLPNFIKEIAPRTFYGCMGMQEIKLPDNLAVIGESAFEECRSLTFEKTEDGWNHLPDKLRIIADLAFTNCDKVERMRLPDGVRKIGKSVFKDCNILKEVYIGKETSKIGESPFRGCRLLRKIEVAVNNRYFRTDEEDHALYNKNRSKLLCFPASNCKNELVAIEDSETLDVRREHDDDRTKKIRKDGRVYIVSREEYREDLGKKIFYCNEQYTKYEIRDSVTEITGWAFSYCSELKVIKASDSVDIIGDNAFFKCTNLDEIKLPDGVNIIDDMAFKNCKKLRILWIPESVDQIGEYITDGCESLEEIITTDDSETEKWYNRIYQGDSVGHPCLVIKDQSVFEDLN